jgi:hypothetical protein
MEKISADDMTIPGCRSWGDSDPACEFPYWNILTGLNSLTFVEDIGLH